MFTYIHSLHINLKRGLVQGRQVRKGLVVGDAEHVEAAPELQQRAVSQQRRALPRAARGRRRVRAEAARLALPAHRQRPVQTGTCHIINTFDSSVMKEISWIQT